MPTLYTIGHSTRSEELFLSLLQDSGIETLADVRAIPASRWNPQFNAARLAQSLSGAGVMYVPMKDLGGRRETNPQSENTGLKEGLRGYADYMQSDEFSAALDRLLTVAKTAPTAILCAEADYLNCHRQLIADAALVRGWKVIHLATPRKRLPHTMTRNAVIKNGCVRYLPSQETLL